MKAIVPAATPVLVELVDGQPTTTSLDVAAHFGKRHDSVLRAIRQLDCSPDFALHNFAECSRPGANNKPEPFFRMTRDGFTFLCMGFTGKEAAKWKEAYISAFNKMETALRAGGLPNIHYPVETLMQVGGHQPRRQPWEAPGTAYVEQWMLFEYGSPLTGLLTDLHRAGYEVGGCLMELEALRHYLTKSRDFISDLRSRSDDLLNEGVRLKDRSRPTSTR